MSIKKNLFIAGALIGAMGLTALAASRAQGGGLVTFTSGTPALASEVNANFGVVLTAADTAQATADDALTLADHSSTGVDSFVGGGVSNTASGDGASVGGGTGNTASGFRSTVAGGDLNNGSGDYSVISGGAFNTASGFVSTVSGGSYNTASEYRATIAGGVGGQARAPFATIGGGKDNVAGNNAVSGIGSTVAGGQDNLASHIFGNVGTNYAGATVGGGKANQATSIATTVAGGGNNHATHYHATVSGGINNYATSVNSVIAGGADNSAFTAGSAVSGGKGNEAGGQYSTVAGGLYNKTLADFSFASGRRAIAAHAGAFVWGDSRDAEKRSAGPDSFNVFASGGSRFFSDAAGTTGVGLAPGSGTWSMLSDREAKENFSAVDPAEVLERLMDVPISTWNYKAQDEAIRHMGPTAQDLHAAFGLGTSDKTIDSIDPDGIALAAIQGLARRNAELVEANAALQERVAALENLAREIEALKALAAAATSAR